MLIDYQKSRGDKFPLSRHINKNPIPKNINLDEEEEQEQEQEQEKNGEEKKDENERNNKNKKEEEEKEEDALVECFICGWTFLKQMDLQEKNTHINMCLEGKGEENKNEIISTYKEIEMNNKIIIITMLKEGLIGIMVRMTIIIMIIKGYL